MKKISATLVALLALTGVALAQFVDQRTWGGTSGGSANAQTISIANYATYTAGVTLRYVAGFTNTGPQTLNVSALGTRNVYKPTAAGPAPLSGGEVVAGQLVEVTYDGAQFQLVSSAAVPAQVAPQGYLTPCPFAGGVAGCSAGGLVPTGDVSAVSILYYTPAVGYLVPISNGSTFVTYAFGELTLAIPASRLANTLYDVCVTTTAAGAFSNNGAPTVVFGPAWTTSTAGAGARGTGAGTAQITRTNGLWVNAVQISAVNGATTYTVPAGQCTTVATVMIGTSNGVVSYSRTYGQSRTWASWNFYNRQQIVLKAGDATASWPYSSATIRASNGGSANSVTVVVGLAEEVVSNSFSQFIDTSSASLSVVNGRVGIGWNSITVFSGYAGRGGASPSSGVTVVGSFHVLGNYEVLAPIGAHVVTSLEQNTNANSITNFHGTEGDMLLTSKWRG